MNDFHLIPVSIPLRVEGTSASDSIGPFSGRVIAIAVRGIDPVATPEPEGNGMARTEGLLGWGTTHMLIADPQRDAPLWVSKDELTSHRIEEQPAADARPRA